MRRKSSSMVWLALVTTLVLALAACAPATDEPDAADPDQQEPVQLEVATFLEGSAWYVYGATMAEVLQQRLPAGSRLEVRPFAGGIGNPELLQTGEADIAFNFTVNARWAYAGSVVYDEPHDRLRGLVGGLDEYYVAVITRGDLGVDSLADIRDQEMGIRLFTLSSGSQGEVVTRLLLDAYGFSYEDINAWGGSVEHTSFDVIQSAFRDGRADVFIHNITPGHPTVTEIAVTTDINFLQLEADITGPLADAHGMMISTLPAGSFEGQDQDVETLGWSTTLTGTADLPDWVAYAIAEAFVEERQTFVDGHRSLEYFQPEHAADPAQLGVPLHPGAEAYYRDAGLLD